MPLGFSVFVPVPVLNLHKLNEGVAWGGASEFNCWPGFSFPLQRVRESGDHFLYSRVATFQRNSPSAEWWDGEDRPVSNKVVNRKWTSKLSFVFDQFIDWLVSRQSNCLLELISEVFERLKHSTMGFNQLTRKFSSSSQLLTRSPFCPSFPAPPRSPFGPITPRSPGGPMLPFSPWSPLGPGDPDLLFVINMDS